MMKPQNLVQRSLAAQKCTVGCPLLDARLSGGVPCNSITELVAESGVGKTQFCLQLALSAQLPLSLGGLSASSLYLHTEFPFPLRRLRQLSHSFRSSHHTLFNLDPCDRIFVHAVQTAHHLLDLMPRIDSFISASNTHFPVRLIVIDSIAALFRSEFDNTPSDLKKRSVLFFKISAKLKALAEKFGLAVVVTNQVVDLVDDQGVNGMRVGNLRWLFTSGRRVSPALGLAWSHCVNSRFFLSRNEEVVCKVNNFEKDDDVEGDDSLCRQTRRRLHVVFAPHLPEISCEFVIRREGVFGVDS